MKRINKHPSTFDRAQAAQRAGRASEAVRLYEKLLTLDANHCGALDALSVMEFRAGHPQRAADLLTRLVELRPHEPRFQLNLGEANRQMGRPTEAFAGFRKALELDPEYPEGLFNLGAMLQQAGQIELAISAFERAVDLKPDAFEFHEGLAGALLARGDAERARLHGACAALLQGSLESAPSHDSICAGARLQRAAGRPELALPLYHAALALRPDSAALWTELSELLRDFGNRPAGAIRAAREAVRAAPRSEAAQNTLAAALADAWKFGDSITAARRAIAIDPLRADAHFHLGRAHLGLGQVEEAVLAYRRAIELDPSHRSAHSALIFALPYVPGYTQTAIAAEARAWAKRHAPPPFDEVRYDHDLGSDRRVRVGYVSEDFRQHPIANFIVPILENHDRTQVEIYCYSSARQRDAVTERIRQAALVFRDVAGVPDDLLATMIRQDQVDVLVDLSLYSGDHRLRTFAARPAPVQITYLGYLGTTGTDAVQYRITAPGLDDARLDGRAAFTEAPLELPSCYWCYDPLEGDETPALQAMGTLALQTEAPALRADETPAFQTETPALQTDETPMLQPVGTLAFELEGRRSAPTADRILFGTQNSFHKISVDAISLWAKVLRALPRSGFVMHAPVEARPRVLSLFTKEGVAGDRIAFLPRRKRREYLLAFRSIDLCLDTIPFNGATTTLDGLWMGTPTLTLVGNTPVGRAGLHIYTNLGLSELVARSSEQFVSKAIELTGDLDRLSGLRSTLRERLRASPLMNASRFVSDLEAAYRQAWRRWCESRPNGTSTA